MDPSLIRFQESQVLIMLKCIICIITRREIQEGKLFVRETSTVVSLLENLPFKSQAHCGEFAEVRSKSKSGLVP